MGGWARMLNSEPVVDQASGLRRMVSPRPVRALAVTGGKGGVGKTNVSVNLGVAAAELGQKVMLLDADLGLANIDVILGMHPKYDLSHVLRGEKDLEDIIVEGPQGISGTSLEHAGRSQAHRLHRRARRTRSRKLQKVENII